MNKVKNFLAKKGIGFWFDIVVVLLGIAAVVCFCRLTAVSEELDEKPIAVVVLTATTALAMAVAAYKDWFGVPSLVAMVLSAFALFAFVGGRVSYLVFYLTGDINQTGLSAWFVATTVLLVSMLVACICAMCSKQEKIQK